MTPPVTTSTRYTDIAAGWGEKEGGSVMNFSRRGEVGFELTSEVVGGLCDDGY